MLELNEQNKGLKREAFLHVLPISYMIRSSFIDFPPYNSAVLFTSGCNFKCLYCHNYDLACCRSNNVYTEKEVINFIKLCKYIDAIVVTGGEPTIYPIELESFLGKIRREFPHLKIKLDTNGSNPDLLKILEEKELVDFIAMDVKNCLDKYKYQEIIQAPVRINKIKESISIVKKIPHQFRITAVKPFHTFKGIAEIEEYIGESVKIQRYVNQEKDFNFSKIQISSLI